jgi:hypothetical protein
MAGRCNPRPPDLTAKTWQWLHASSRKRPDFGRDRVSPKGGRGRGGAASRSYVRSVRRAPPVCRPIRRHVGARNWANAMVRWPRLKCAGSRQRGDRNHANGEVRHQRVAAPRRGSPSVCSTSSLTWKRWLALAPARWFSLTRATRTVGRATPGLGVRGVNIAGVLGGKLGVGCGVQWRWERE